MDPESMYTVFSPAGAVVMTPMRDGRARLMAQIRDAPGTPLNLHPTQEICNGFSMSGSVASRSPTATG